MFFFSLLLVHQLWIHYTGGWKHIFLKGKASLCSLYISRTVHLTCFIPTATLALVTPNKALANLRLSVNFSISTLQSLLSVQYFGGAVLKKAACSITAGQEIKTNPGTALVQSKKEVDQVSHPVEDLEKYGAYLKCSHHYSQRPC